MRKPQGGRQAHGCEVARLERRAHSPPPTQSSSSISSARSVRQRMASACAVVAGPGGRRARGCALARHAGRRGGRQAGRRLGAERRICPCRRRQRCLVVDGCGTAAGAGIRRNRLSMLVSFCRPRFPRLRAVLAGARCSPAIGARRRRRTMLGLTVPWTSLLQREPPPPPPTTTTPTPTPTRGGEGARARLPRAGEAAARERGWRCSPPTARDARAYCALDL
jgi:hypothetical protein